MNSGIPDAKSKVYLKFSNKKNAFPVSPKLGNNKQADQYSVLTNRFQSKVILKNQ